jgi:hypothetical protein
LWFSGTVKVNSSAEFVSDVPAAVVTVMSTVPADSAGETAVISVELGAAKLRASTPSNSTAVTSTKPAPEIVTEVPPEVVPLEGEMSLTYSGERGLTSMDNGLVAIWAVGVSESVTSTVKSTVPEELGVPVISPVEGSRLRPSGRVPFESDHV